MIKDTPSTGIPNPKILLMNSIRDYWTHTFLHYQISVSNFIIQCQNQDDKEQVIAYWSRQLLKAEQNYSTIKKEALAEVPAINDLYGLSTKLVTDHNLLTSLKGLKDIRVRLWRWMIFLQQFNFQFEYKPRRSHDNVDTICRRPSTQNVATTIHQLDIDPDNMRRTQLADEQLAPVIEALKEGKPLPVSSAPRLHRIFIQNWFFCQKFQSLFFLPTAKTQLVITSNMKATVLQQLHNNTGHLSLWKTTKSLSGCNMSWILKNGYENASKAMLHIPNHKHHLELLKLPDHLKRYPRILCDIMGPLPPF